VSMKAAKIVTDQLDWKVFAGPGGRLAEHNGVPFAYIKELSDRRKDGRGYAYLLRLVPPPDRLVRIIAVARSDEHVFLLEGGYCNKAGELIASPGAYGLNVEGSPHSAFCAIETVGYVVCTGEPDEIRGLDIVPIEAARA
jgi:hypothetical protein